MWKLWYLFKTAEWRRQASMQGMHTLTIKGWGRDLSLASSSSCNFLLGKEHTPTLWANKKSTNERIEMSGVSTRELACVLQSAFPSHGIFSLSPPAPSSPAPCAPLRSVAALLLLSFFPPPSWALLPAVREVENAKVKKCLNYVNHVTVRCWSMVKAEQRGVTDGKGWL